MVQNKDAFLSCMKALKAIWDKDPEAATNLLLGLEETWCDDERWILYFADDLRFGERWVPGMVKGADINLSCPEGLYELLEDKLLAATIDMIPELFSEED